MVAPMVFPMQFRVRERTNRIILHDSLTPSVVPNALEFVRHTAMLYGHLDIGYHFIILADGSRMVGRPVGVVGSHTPGHNEDSIGVCMIGGLLAPGHLEFPFPQEQVDGVKALVEDLMGMYPECLGVFAHSEVQNYRKGSHRKVRSCPAIDMRRIRS